MIFGKKKNKAPAKEEEIVVTQNPVSTLRAGTNRLWSALNAMDEAEMQYESAVLAAHDNELEKYDKAINTARREMKCAKFCVQEVFGSLLAEVERGH